MTGFLGVDIERMTRQPEGQGCRAALDPGEGFISVMSAEQVRQSVGDHGGAKASHTDSVSRLVPVQPELERGRSR